MMGLLLRGMLALSTTVPAHPWAAFWDRKPVQSDLVQISVGLSFHGDEVRYLGMSQILSHLGSPLLQTALLRKDSHLPGGERPYRRGWHQGMDLYPLEVEADIEVFAAAEGLVLRSDHEYVELLENERSLMLRRQPPEGPTLPEDLDRLHGRQVWILHASGVVTRYSHLVSVSGDIFRGQWVARGELLGLMGNTGTAAAADKRQGGVHLHFEIHTQSGPFWQGLNQAQVQGLIEEILRR